MKRISTIMVMILMMTMHLRARDLAFTYEGQTLNYTVLDEDTKTVITKAGTYKRGGMIPGNVAEGDLVIPSSIQDTDMVYTVIGIGDDSFSENTALHSVLLPETISQIGDNAFSGCAGLSEINLPSNIRKVGTAAFSGTGIVNVQWPEEAVEIPQSAFLGCSSLTSVSLPPSIEIIGNNGFKGCSSLTEIVLPDSMSEIGISAFESCKALKIFF